MEAAFDRVRNGGLRLRINGCQVDVNLTGWLIISILKRRNILAIVHNVVFLDALRGSDFYWTVGFVVVLDYSVSGESSSIKDN